MPSPAENNRALLRAEAQPALPLPTALRMVLSGIGFRVLRSGITVSIQALAVAFLVFTLAGGLLERRVAAAAAERLAPVTADRVAVTRLGRPDPPAEVAAVLATGRPPGAYRAWSGLDGEAFGAVTGDAVRLARAEAWLSGLGPADAAAVLGGRTPAAAARRLNAEEEASAFAAAVDGLRPGARAGLPVADGAALAALMTEGRARVVAAVAAVAEGHAAAVAALARRYPAEDPAALVADGRAGLPVELERLGFDPAAVAAATDEARRLADAATLGEALQRPAARQALGRALGRPAAEVDAAAVLRLAADPAGAAEVVATLRDAGVATPPAERLAALSAATDRTRAWAAASAGATSGGGRTALLLGLSALVCVVGIGNAMLMSVTERFGEIATMKCLGARSGSILSMYLLESLLLGVVGAAAGATLGLLLAVLAAWASTGPLLALALPASGEVTLAVLLAAAVGVALSAVAAVLPSLLAARLSPMEALRVE